MKYFSAILCGMLMGGLATQAAPFSYDEGEWNITLSADNTLTINHGGKAIFNSAYASVKYNLLGESEEYTIDSSRKGEPAVEVATVEDEFGSGKSYILSYSDERAVMHHTLNFYPSLPYMIAQVSVESREGKTLQSNTLLALGVKESSIPVNGTCRMVWVPFDNDAHLKYNVVKMEKSEPLTSHEVGYLFDGETRKGLVAGSVDHDSWKSGVTIAGSNGFKMERFECLSGLTNYFTHDALPHGKVKGEKVSSARFFVGVYDDWREGLNDFGEANTKVAPRATWSKGNPIGWSSWGVQMNYINYNAVLDCASFIKKELYDKGFHDNDGQTVISLDAFATDNISAAQLYTMGTKLFKNGTYKDGRETKEGSNQILGEYCGPLIAWRWALDGKMDGTGLNGTPTYTVRDCALRVNGDVFNVWSSGNDAMAIDPTHPGVKANIEYFMRQYATNGVKYIKADFLNAGICEGDSWYDPEITTGVQAYNYGMKLLYEEAEKYGMYIVESISPTFPYRWAHGRRICCDRFSEIGESEFVMNAITYGWWTDKLYTVNDPDQLVMCKAGSAATPKETIGENRARATTGMTSGAYIFGDNFSEACVYTDDNGHTRGDVVGYPEESRRRAMEIMGNEAINEYVRNNTGSFMPVDGHKSSTSQMAEYAFVRRTGDYVYLALFNYGVLFNKDFSYTLERLGVGADEIDTDNIRELWTGEPVALNGETLFYSVPAKDARVIRIALRNGSGGVGEIKADGSKGEGSLRIIRTAPHCFALEGDLEVAAYAVYDIAGGKVAMGGAEEIDLSGCREGIYLVESLLGDGSRMGIKIVNR